MAKHLVLTNEKIRMRKITLSRRTIKKILPFKTNRIPLIDVKNKLEIFAVKEGLKPAYAGTTDLVDVNSIANDDLLLLRQLATMMGLKYELTNTPPLYFSRKPNVPNDFLNTYYTQTDFQVLWIYDDPTIEQKIRKCLSGKLNEGHIFGYPECCIKWHEKKRVLEVESAFLQKTKELQRVMDKHVLETYMKYPFVSHWACSACLSGRSKRTEELNDKYRELALGVGENFEKTFLQNVKQTLRDFKRRKHPIV